MVLVAVERETPSALYRRYVAVAAAGFGLTTAKPTGVATTGRGKLKTACAAADCGKLTTNSNAKSDAKKHFVNIYTTSGSRPFKIVIP
jgi:hypothetical protein